MEQVLETLQNEFKDSVYTNAREKISFAIGYMMGNDKVNKDQALEIIRDILRDKI